MKIRLRRRAEILKIEKRCLGCQRTPLELKRAQVEFVRRKDLCVECLERYQECRRIQRGDDF